MERMGRGESFGTVHSMGAPLSRSNQKRVERRIALTPIQGLPFMPKSIPAVLQKVRRRSETFLGLGPRASDNLTGFPNGEDPQARYKTRPS